ncbi:MAG: AcrR family transcriptional regulator [Cyclobacteriaceae bacterium]
MSKGLLYNYFHSKEDLLTTLVNNAINEGDHIHLSMLALLVNIIPLLITGAIMGYMGIPLKISTALIFTIVLGIAVDDTIHFLHHYISMV